MMKNNDQRSLRFVVHFEVLTSLLGLLLSDWPVIAWRQVRIVRTQPAGLPGLWKDWQPLKTPHLLSSHCCPGCLDSPSPPAAPSEGDRGTRLVVLRVQQTQLEKADCRCNTLAWPAGWLKAPTLALGALLWEFGTDNIDIFGVFVIFVNFRKQFKKDQLLTKRSENIRRDYIEIVQLEKKDYKHQYDV